MHNSHGRHASRETVTTGIDPQTGASRESRHQQCLCDGIVMLPTPLSPELNLDAVDHRDPCCEEVPPGLGRRRR